MRYEARWHGGMVRVAGCSAAPRRRRPGRGAPPAAGGRQINGAGATFPNPMYSKWFAEYNKLHPNVRINYQSLGSGAGIRQLTSRTVFFGATDQPMKDEQLQAAPGKILHFPTVLGAVVPIYNLPEVSRQLKFSGPLLADIVLGKVKKWNDPAIVKLNPGVKLPAMDITFVHRSEGSGTTFIFADYLGKVSPEFKSKVGVDSSLKWPVGVGGKGNEGVSGMVRQTPGSLGYVELVYALQNKIAYGSVQNSAGAFVGRRWTRDRRGGGRRRQHAARLPRLDHQRARRRRLSHRVVHLDPALRGPAGQGPGETMKDFMRWALTDGQKLAPELGYASCRRRSWTWN